MKTVLMFTLEHDKPLPSDGLELISNRIYTLLFSRGIDVEIGADELPIVEANDER